MVFKCKMCDASLNIKEGDKITTCEYCGTTQTVPQINNERVANLYNRADHYRKNNEFDKALALYEEILNECPTDAEAYWSIILCQYGIEYVEEGGKRIPTVNRMQLTSIFDDQNYKAALKYAQPEQSTVYQAEANAINEIQKEILAISKTEEPFDIFICYKETDERGRRTMDSVLATDIYDKLTDAGYKVFFARVTLDDKFGVAYEPYIFAALQSSKIMIAIGTKPEYFNAVWVRNEWSRYLGMIKKGAKKTLIPAYKDMDPYAMPEEFAHLQAINMGELGFHQDLLHGIRKILGAQSPVAKAGATKGNVSVDGLVERAFIYLESEDWDFADECLEMVLNNDPRKAEAYLGKLLISLKIPRKDSLGTAPVSFENDANYQRVLRFGDEELKKFVQDALELVKENEHETKYQETCKIARNTIYPAILLDCAKTFEEMGDYKDSRTLAEECRKRADDAKEKQKEDSYKFYCGLMRENDTKKLEVAMKYFEANRGYKDCSDRAQECQRLINQLVSGAADSFLAKNNEKEDDGMEDAFTAFGEFMSWVFDDRK